MKMSQIFNDENTHLLYDFYGFLKEDYNIFRPNYGILEQDIFIFFKIDARDIFIIKNFDV